MQLYGRIKVPPELMRLIMSDDDYKDESGVLSILMSLVVLVSMSALPATIGWYQVFAG